MKQTIFALLLLLMSSGQLSAQTPLLVVPTGHSSHIRAFTCTADGKYFVTLGEDDLIKFWNEEGKEIRSIRTPAFRYMDLQLSPDNEHLLAASNFDYNEAYVLDIDSGKELFTLSGHRSGVRCGAYSPDGKIIATGAYDADAILWNAGTGALLHKLSEHMGSIVSLAFSPDGKLLATLAEDKTARIWETSSGKLLRVLETGENPAKQILFSPDGKILSIGTITNEKGISLWSVKDWKKMRELDGYSALFSPDGQWIALSGMNATNLYPSDHLDEAPVQVLRASAPPSDGPMMFDAQSGFFMPDSKSILLNCASGAPELFDIETGKLKFALKGYALPVNYAAVSPDGKKIVLSSKTDLMEWDLTQGQLSKHLKGRNGNITNAQYSPDGQKIISVTENSSGAMWDVNTGKETQPLQQGYPVWPVQSYVNILAMAPNGETFVRGHSFGIINGPPILSMWSLADGRRVDSLYADAMAKDVAYATDGQRLAMATDDSLLFFDFPTRKWETLAIADHSVASGYRYSYNAVVFLDNYRLAAGTNHGEVEFWDVRKKKKIAKDTRPDWYNINDLACSPDGQWLAAGFVNKNIGLWHCKPNKVPQFAYSLEGHDDWVQSIEFSPDSRRLVSTSQDNTVRIWDLEKKTEIAKIVHLNLDDWAVTTPSGLFDASPGAMELMYFILGDEIIELEQLKARYYEPGLLSKLLGLSSGELRHVEQFKNVALYPKIEAKIEQDELIIHLLPRNGGIGKLSLFVNGSEVAEEDINPQRRSTLTIDLKAFEKHYLSDKVNVIALRAYNGEGWLKSQAYKINYTYIRAKGSGESGETSTLGDAKPRLFALVVGTANYSGDKLDLKYADQDATAIAGAMTAAGKELFGDDVQVQLFSTGNFGENTASANDRISSKTNIQKAFDTLALPGRVLPTDILLLYFSGHGITYGEAEKAQFYYLTKDISSEDLSDPEVRANLTISSDELIEWIKDIPALKRVLILDACNSGKIVESFAAIGQKDLNPSQVRAFDRMKDRTGIFILTGSAADKVSYEASQFGQGLLTYSLLEGMSGPALGADNRLDVMTLFQHARNKVPEMAKSINGIQTPILSFPANGGSFDIGIVNEKVKIPLAQVKPVFIRNNFQDEDAFEDVLGLTNALEQHFLKMTAKGAQSKIMYWDVKEYENAYSMKGRYHVTGNAVDVRVRLFKGKIMVGEEFKVNGMKDDLPGLVKAILSQVMPMAK